MLFTLRLVLSFFLFLISTLTVLKAPTNILWKVSIIAMEWGHYLALITLILVLLPNLNSNKISIGLSILATILFLTPYVQAISLQSKIEKEIVIAFPHHEKREEPIKPANILNPFKKVSFDKQHYEILEYKEGLTLDFYKSSIPKTPCIVVIHGGGWDSGDSQQLADLNEYLAFKGYAVASINYRLAPQNKYPEQIADVRDAIKFLKENALELGIDSQRLVLLGRSAGGQLALQAAYAYPDRDIKGVVSFYAPADMVWGYSIPGNPWIMDSRKVLCDYIGGACDVVKDKYLAASPMEHISPNAPPTLILHGRPDVLVAFEHSRRLNEKLKQANVPHYLVDIPWATHGYDYNFNGPASRISTYAIEYFLKYVTSQNPVYTHASKEDSLSWKN